MISEAARIGVRTAIARLVYQGGIYKPQSDAPCHPRPAGALLAADKAHRDGIVRSGVTEAHGQLRNECLICRSIDTVPSVYLPLQKY